MIHSSTERSNLIADSSYPHQNALWIIFASIADAHQKAFSYLILERKK